MENGKWEMENGKWENGKWEMGKWEMDTPYPPCYLCDLRGLLRLSLLGIF